MVRFENKQRAANYIRNKVGTSPIYSNGHTLRKDDLRALAEHVGADVADDATNAELRAAILIATEQASIHTTAEDTPHGFREVELLRVARSLADEEDQ